MNSSVLKFIWAAASLLCLSAAHFVRSETKPNIVIMLMDDVSYSSVVEILCRLSEFTVSVYLAGYASFSCAAKPYIFSMNLVE